MGWQQEGFRFRYDDGGETAAGWIDSQDTNIEREKNLNTRIRIIVYRGEYLLGEGGEVILGEAGEKILGE